MNKYKKKKIFFWSVHIDKVATINSILNTFKSLKIHSSRYDMSIINAIGEWDEYKNKLEELKINKIDLNKKKIINQIPKGSFLKSRLSYWIIFFCSIVKLKKLIKQEKPDYLIVHLLVFIPLVLFLMFNFDTRLILRISGLPKLNLVRKAFWRLSNKKIFKVITPTYGTKNDLIIKNIFDRNKIFVLRDPILDFKLAKIKKREDFKDLNFYKNSITMIGRLTKQKNYEIFIRAFKKIEKKYPDLRVNIFGEGELKSKLQKQITRLELNDKFYFAGYKKNIYGYLSNSKYFILTSLWEDPGFVIIEAAFSNTLILSSNCKHGPTEFIGKKNEAGLLFQNNSEEDLINKFEIMLNLSKDEVMKKRIEAKKRCRNFTFLKHANHFQQIIH